MAGRRKGRWEGGEFLPMLSATELARPFRVTPAAVSAAQREAARRRGEAEHERFDRAAQRHLDRPLHWGRSR